MNNDKKVYIVIGACVDINNSLDYINLSKHSVKSTLRNAQKELKLIKNEILKDMLKNGFSYDDLIIEEDENNLEITCDNKIESYTIEERVIDF